MQTVGPGLIENSVKIWFSNCGTRNITSSVVEFAMVTDHVTIQNFGRLAIHRDFMLLLLKKKSRCSNQIFQNIFIIVQKHFGAWRSKATEVPLTPCGLIWAELRFSSLYMNTIAVESVHRLQPERRPPQRAQVF